MSPARIWGAPSVSLERLLWCTGVPFAEGSVSHNNDRNATAYIICLLHFSYGIHDISPRQLYSIYGGNYTFFIIYFMITCSWHTSNSRSDNCNIYYLYLLDSSIFSEPYEANIITKDLYECQFLHVTMLRSCSKILENA